MEKSKSELDNEIRRLKEKCQDIIRECNKWKGHPEAVFRHGYAREKALGIMAIIERN